MHEEECRIVQGKHKIITQDGLFCSKCRYKTSVITKASNGYMCKNCINGKSKKVYDPRLVSNCDCVYCWKVAKQWRSPEEVPIFHLIEAFADSGNQALVHDNKDKTHDRLNRILKVCREEIMRHPDVRIDRCKYMEPGTRAKCGNLLVRGRCSVHGLMHRQKSLEAFT